MTRPRVIVNALPEDYVLVGRVVQVVTAASYEWPADGITSIAFCSVSQKPWQGRTFGVRRNKSSITVYGPGKTA